MAGQERLHAAHTTPALLSPSPRWPARRGETEKHYCSSRGDNNSDLIEESGGHLQLLLLQPKRNLDTRSGRSS
jgi:hypothetical protein